MDKDQSRYLGVQKGLLIYDIGEVRVAIFPHPLENNFYTEIYYQQLQQTGKQANQVIRDGVITSARGNILESIAQDCELHKRRKAS
jgi:hypothetical protein